MPGFPTGNATFLLTDVEASTALWERDPEAMALAIAAHDDLLRIAVETNGGAVVKGLGDGIYAVFATPADAVSAAQAALDWARSVGDGPLVGELALEFSWYLVERALTEEAAASVGLALELLPETSPLKMHLLRDLLFMARNLGESARALELARMIQVTAEALGNDVAAAQAQSIEAEVRSWQGDLETALTLNTAALERLLEAGDVGFEGAVIAGMEILCDLGRYDDAEALVDRLEGARPGLRGAAISDYRVDAFRGTIATKRGDYARAAELFRACVEPARKVGPVEEGAMLVQWGLAEFNRGNYTASKDLTDRGLALLPDAWADAVVWANTIPALIELEEHDPASAVPNLRRALRIVAHPDAAIQRTEALIATAAVAIDVDRAGEAAILLGAARSASERIEGLVPPAWVRRLGERVAAQVERNLGAGESKRLFNQGRALSYEEAAAGADALLDGIESMGV